LSSEAAVFTLLDSHVIDYAIGDYFFHDHFRMHQGILSHSPGRVSVDDSVTPVAAHSHTHAKSLCRCAAADALCAGAKLALDILFPQSANSTIGCLPDNAFKGI
jgi:hypothetical protein